MEEAHNEVNVEQEQELEPHDEPDPEQQNDDVYRLRSPSGYSFDSQNSMFDLGVFLNIEMFEVNTSTHVPAVVLGEDIECEVPQIHNPVLEPHTKSSTPSIQTLKHKKPMDRRLLREKLQVMEQIMKVI